MCWLLQSAELWHCPTFLLYPLALVAGIECFAGYHAWRFLLGFNGAIFGFIIGVVFSTLLGSWVFVLLGALVGAVAGAFFFASIVPLGSTVFVFTSMTSFMILVGRIGGWHREWYLPVAVITGIAMAVGALTVRRPVIITLAAAAGAQQIAAAWSAYHLPCDTVPCPDRLIPTEWWLFAVLAAGGLLVQWATSRTRPTQLVT